MDTVFQDILHAQEQEDSRLFCSDADRLNAFCGEFSNAQRLLAQAKEKGFSLSDFFSGAPLPAGLELPVRQSQTFYVKKHTAVQRPYMHAHEFCELLYVQAGKCLQTLQNGDRVTLQKGQFCLLRPGRAHRIERVGRNDVILKAVVPCELFARAAQGVELPEEDFVVFAPISLFAEYVFIRLLREDYLHGMYSETAVCALLTLLLCELARGRVQKEPEAGKLYAAYFQTELDKASLTHFAKTFGYTPAYASRWLKRQTGRTFSELLREYRLQRAAALLASTDRSVEDIALAVGYKVPSALYKHFGKHFGMTPTEYRSALRRR